MNNVESRVLALERQFFANDLAALEARLAALENGLWKTIGGGYGILNPSLESVRPALTGTNGIPSLTTSGGTDTAGSATVTISTTDAAGVVTGTDTVTAWNFFGAPISGATKITVGRVLTDGGEPIWLVLAVPAAWYRVTTTITARSGATYGSGVGKLQNDSGTAWSDSSNSTASQTIKNGTIFAIASGAAGSNSYVLCEYAHGKLWAALPGACAILS